MIGLNFAIRGRGKQWSPLMLSSLKAWFATESMVVTSGAVSTWTDQSGNGNSVTQATGANRPAYSAAAINGHAAASFNGTSHRLLATKTLFTSAYTYALVVKNQGADDGFLIFNGNPSGGSASGAALRQLSTSKKCISHTNVGEGTVAGLSGNWELWIATFTGSAAAFYVNGVAQTITTPPGSVIAPGASARLILGARITTADVTDLFAHCQIAEAMVFNVALTGANLANLTRYLRNKYSL